MKRHRTSAASSAKHPRRGVTLVEMLVAVALLVLVMTILTTIFRSATGAVTAVQTIDGLDQNLRRLDAVLRRDLQGCTARFTPGITRPSDNRGYFEYSEGELADLQGEDVDDYIAFTAKAPEGQPFIGRIYVPTVIAPAGVPTLSGVSPQMQPISVTSDFAEIIYFCREGNLYRRVLLIAPERSRSVDVGRAIPAPNPPDTTSQSGPFNPGGGYASLLPAGGYGTNAASPEPFGPGQVSWQGLNDLSVHPAASGSSNVPIPNSLVDLTNRENRFARPRFCNDYLTTNTGGAPILGPDGIPDDEHYDPAGNFLRDGIHDFLPSLYPNVFNVTNLTHEITSAGNANGPAWGPPNRMGINSLDTMPFPYLFPGAYSKLPSGSAAFVAANHPAAGAVHSLDPTGGSLNHSPLLNGDSLAIPNLTNATALQTWWGYPTWRETTSQFWTDPVIRLNDTKFNPNRLQNMGLSWVSPFILPIITNDVDPFTDAVALNANVTTIIRAGGQTVYQDDLIMTGVRSFDVKAYDNSPRVFNPTTGAVTGLTAGYYDLGYEQRLDLFPATNFAGSDTNTPLFIQGSFAHEGRIPPLTTDNRFDPQIASIGGLKNIGDNTAGVLRLRRVWDSWSTDYSFVNGLTYYPGYGFPFSVDATGTPTAPYPSYPPPYPGALRGIQISIRVADPRGQFTKSITVRQDFTDKLE
jgi:prepilin-type N-terminal cleavage/methylation domain-containing protein